MTVLFLLNLVNAFVKYVRNYICTCPRSTTSILYFSWRRLSLNLESHKQCGCKLAGTSHNHLTRGPERDPHYYLWKWPQNCISQSIPSLYWLRDKDRAWCASRMVRKSASQRILSTMRLTVYAAFQTPRWASLFDCWSVQSMSELFVKPPRALSRHVKDAWIIGPGGLRLYLNWVHPPPPSTGNHGPRWLALLLLLLLLLSVVTGQCPFTLALRNGPGKKHTQTKGGTRIYCSWRKKCLRQKHLQKWNREKALYVPGPFWCIRITVSAWKYRLLATQQRLSRLYCTNYLQLPIRTSDASLLE